MTKQSAGLTATERLLAEFCERSFLKLWSYPNPYKDDGQHELCDLLAVFGNYVFIFFDRKNELPEISDKSEDVLWNRWKRNVIDKQIKTAHGAERYIRSGRSIFLDAKGTKPFPLLIDRENIVIHKIIVAHGAKEACERASAQNVYGSLAITYTAKLRDSTEPFHVEIDKNNPVHIFDSHNMPIVLQELNTVSDFSAYLDEKVRAVKDLELLNYCGEEDLLSHYLLNYDENLNRHIIGSKAEQANAIMIGEGDWHSFIQTDLYKNTKREDATSYFWDELIQRTCQNSLTGTLGGNSNIAQGQSAIYEMVKEPRFMRRGISEKMLAAVKRFPDVGAFARHVTLLPSFEPGVTYLLLQVRAPDAIRTQSNYRENRLAILEIACGAAKNKFPELLKIIGIGIDAPKFSDGIDGEDFILMPCDIWTDELRSYYEKQNEPWQFFGTPQMRQFKDTINQFVHPSNKIAKAKSFKIGRNDPCPCGSSKKYKKCCI